jgi:hypothetical protein
MLACASSPRPPGRPAGESPSRHTKPTSANCGRAALADAGAPAARARDLGRRVRVTRLGRAAAPSRRGGGGRGGSGDADGEARGPRLRGPPTAALGGRLRHRHGQRLRRLLSLVHLVGAVVVVVVVFAVVSR